MGNEDKNNETRVRRMMISGNDLSMYGDGEGEWLMWMISKLLY